MSGHLARRVRPHLQVAPESLSPLRRQICDLPQRRPEVKVVELDLEPSVAILPVAEVGGEGDAHAALRRLRLHPHCQHEEGKESHAPEMFNLQLQTEPTELRYASLYHLTI